MKTSVVSKLLQAKKLEYEACKELMPENIREHMELSEKHLKKQLRDIGYQVYTEFSQSSQNESNQNNETKESHKKSVTID